MRTDSARGLDGESFVGRREHTPDVREAMTSTVYSDTTLATGEKVRKFSLPGTFEVLLQEDLVVTCVIFPFCACVERRLYWTNQINLIVAEAVAGHHAQFCATRPHFNSITLLALIVVFASRSQSHPPSGSD